MHNSTPLITTIVGGHPYERLGLPKEAVHYIGEAYFEDGSHTESVHSAVLIDRSRLPG